MNGFAVLIVFVLFLLLPAYRYWTWFKYLRWRWRAIGYYEREERWRKGLCVKCGYDLRASRDRCPECGTAVTLPVKPAKPG